VAISARRGSGTERLQMAIEATLESTLVPISVRLPYERGDLLSLFYDRGQVAREYHDEGGILVDGRIPGRMRPMFRGYESAGSSEEE